MHGQLIDRRRRVLEDPINERAEVRARAHGRRTCSRARSMLRSGDRRAGCGEACAQRHQPMRAAGRVRCCGRVIGEQGVESARSGSTHAQQRQHRRPWLLFAARERPAGQLIGEPV